MNVKLNDVGARHNDADLYEILDLEKGASREDVKRAYRKLALRYHPDKNPCDPEAAEKFKEISNANSVLGDRDKRRLYDEHGSMGVFAVEEFGLLELTSKCWFKALVFLCTVFSCCCCCCFCCCFGCCGRCADDQSRGVRQSYGDEDSVHFTGPAGSST